MAYLQHAHHRAFRLPGLNVRANERNEPRFNFRVQPNLDKIKPRAWVIASLRDLHAAHFFFHPKRTEPQRFTGER